MRTQDLVRRILATFDRASAADIEAGAAWYGEAGAIVREMAIASGRTVEECAAVVSHLSPRTPWARNVSGAWSLIMTGAAPGCLGANVDRARAALGADDILATFGGPKTRRFFLNIMGDRSAVTVDVWAARVALGARDDLDLILRRVGAYDQIERAYRIAATRRAVDATTMQATTWIVARNGRAA